MLGKLLLKSNTIISLHVTLNIFIYITFALSDIIFITLRYFYRKQSVTNTVNFLKTYYKISL